jgi:pimeloyl-ACP methyl ester carboxylesterase
MAQGPEGSTLLAKPLIIFVHGLGGDKSTWGDFGHLIESDPDLQDRVDVRYYSYPSSAIRFWPFKRSMKIQEISLGLKTEITVRYHEYDNILLICHSLGGLVGKYFLCDQIKKNEKLNVKGIVFFATPHTGSVLAAVADRLSLKHHHIKQLRVDADILSLLEEDWDNLSCASKLRVEYIIGGSDVIVTTESGAPRGSNPKLIPGRGHIDIVKPGDTSEMSYLIVKHLIRSLFFDDSDDLNALRIAIAEGNRQAVLALVANHGRSWIETTEADVAIALLTQVSTTFSPSAAEVIWARYLIAISRLFRDRDTSSTTFDDAFIQHAEAIDLGPLILAEIMEFARKRNDRKETILAAGKLLESLDGVTSARGPHSAYALGTSHFLLGNLYRYGGQYREAKSWIGRAVSFYRPTILSHQIELAHCHYSLAVCHAMEGELWREDISPQPLGSELRRFSEALITLARSHSAWAVSNVGEAEDLAKRAAAAFNEIRFAEYNRRANSLMGLLAAWYRLDYGSGVDKAITSAQEHASVIRGMPGDPAALGGLKDWISRSRPSLVLGILQFASSFATDWTQPIGEFSLPPVLQIGTGGLEWCIETCSTLAEADRRLRELMRIPLGVRLPLLAD